MSLIYCIIFTGWQDSAAFSIFFMVCQAKSSVRVNFFIEGGQVKAGVFGIFLRRTVKQEITFLTPRTTLPDTPQFVYFVIFGIERLSSFVHFSHSQ